MAHKTVIFQAPSAILILSIVISVIAVGMKFLKLAPTFEDVVVSGAVVGWSSFGYDETRYGVSWVRRALGLSTLIAIVVVTTILIHNR